jgi:hypothetical protein
MIEARSGNSLPAFVELKRVFQRHVQDPTAQFDVGKPEILIGENPLPGSILRNL